MADEVLDPLAALAPPPPRARPGRTRWWRRTGWFLVGLTVGFVLVLALLWLYLQSARWGMTTAPVAPLTLQRADDAPPAWRPRPTALIELEAPQLTDPGDGRVAASAPAATLRLDLRSLTREDAPVTIDTVELVRPDLRLRMLPDGAWNVLVALTPPPPPHPPARPSPGLLVRALRADGATVATQVAGQTMRATDVSGHASGIRVTDAGWQVTDFALAGRTVEPAWGETRLAGTARGVADGPAIVELREAATTRSRLAGTVRFLPVGGEAQLRGTLALADARAFAPRLTVDGQATVAEARLAWAPERARIELDGLDLTTTDGSHVRGRLAAHWTRAGGLHVPRLALQLAPLRWATLMALLPPGSAPTGLADFDGALEGEITERGVDLRVRLARRDGRGGVARLRAMGPWRLGPPPELHGVALAFDELPLARLRPGPGIVRGRGTLTGTAQALSLRDGLLVVEAPNAPISRWVDVNGTLRLNPLRYELSGVAAPLALPTLQALGFGPALQGTLAGPLRLEGTAERLAVAGELAGAQGRVVLAARTDLPPGPFAATLRLEDFVPGGVAAGAPNLPLSGRLDARGTPQSFRVDADLTAPEGGRLQLTGPVAQRGGQWIVDLQGQATTFPIGALVGRPGLLNERLSGPLSLRGGGREPYRLRADLRGATARLQLDGRAGGGAAGALVVSGRLVGFDLRQLPLGRPLPATNLDVSLQSDLRRTADGVWVGQLDLRLGPSTLASRPVDRGLVSLRSDGTTLRLDTVELAYGGARLAGGGAWGWRRSVAEPLRLRFEARELATLQPLLLAIDPTAPPLEGRLQASAELGGTVRNPVVGLHVNGQRLRFGEQRLGTIGVQALLVRQGRTVGGEIALVAQRLQVAGQSWASLRARLRGRPDDARLDAELVADPERRLRLVGRTVETADLGRVLQLDSLDLRAPGQAWALVAPAYLAVGPRADGLWVRGFALRQRDGVGVLAIDGRLPASGEASLRGAMRGFDLALLRPVMPPDLPLGGTLTGRWAIAGPVRQPTVDVALEWRAVQVRAARFDSVALRLRGPSGDLSLGAELYQAGRRALHLEGQLPLVLATTDLVPRLGWREGARVTAVLGIDSLDLGMLAALVPGVEASGGLVNGELRVTGPPRNPDLSGQLAWRQGILRLAALGTTYQAIDAEATLANDRLALTATARNGGGASLRGSVRVLDTWTRPLIDLGARFDRFRLLDRDRLARLTVSGDVQLGGRLPAPELTGQLVLSNSEIDLPAPIEERAPTVELAEVEVGAIGPDTAGVAALRPGPLSQLRVRDLEVVAGEGVWAVAANARAQLRGSVVVYRAGNTLLVSGDLETVRGTYTLQVGPIERDFDIVGGQVRFFGTPDFNPALDVLAASRTRLAGTAALTLTVYVRVTGTARNPRVQLTSESRVPVPETELLSYLIFGRPSVAVGDVGQVLTQQILAQEVVGGLLFAPLEQLLLQSGLPVEYVRIRTYASPLSPLGGTSLELGTQLAPDLFFSVECLLGSALLFGLSPSGATCGLGLDLQIDPNAAARLSYAPLRRDPLLQPYKSLPYQWAVELRRRWRFGLPPRDSAAPLAPAAPPPR